MAGLGLPRVVRIWIGLGGGLKTWDVNVLKSVDEGSCCAFGEVPLLERYLDC